MSAPIALIVDPMRVRAYVAAPAEPLFDEAWDARAPMAVVDRLRAVGGAPSRIVLIVGTGFLEIARPDLPPMADDARQTLLQRDADRYFPISGSVATSWCDGLAFAMPAATLAEWTRAFGILGPVVTVLALPCACADAGLHGTFSARYDTEAAVEEVAVLELGHGELRDARRVAGSGVPVGASPLDLSQLATACLRMGARAESAQLLDQALSHEMQRRRRNRFWRSTAALAAALVLLAWSADRWRDRSLQALDLEVRSLTGAAVASERALQRLERAATERALLARADSAEASGTSAAQVLARLGALLPADAFVQRLEWDGTAWRIDGSASDAPRLVPLLDGDARFSDVRAVAASTRFLDAGKQRESFSIAFRTRVANRSANASR
jgi:hypothetical protein